MKSGITAKAIAIWFAIVAGLYFAVFYGIEYGNHRKGAWEVEFLSDEMGNPSIVIYQPKLKISSVEMIFGDEKVASTNLATKLSFDRPLTSLPFKLPIGEVIYEDLRTLPGVVTFNFFGHEVELLPRVLIVNKKEVSWKSEMVLELSRTNKPPQIPQPPKGWEQKPAPDRMF